MMLDAVIFIALLTGAIAAGWMAYVGWTIRRRSVVRLYDQGRAHAVEPVSARQASQPWIGRWLSLAGIRGRNAVAMFLACTAGLTVAGAVAGFVYRRWLVGPLVTAVSNIPGGVGEALAATLLVGSWILLLLAACAPTLVVRAMRRQRVRAVERDLPLALELLATMAEAGLGFDAALAHIVRSQPRTRPLIAELMVFQRDMIAGVPRIEAFRQLSKRVEVASLTGFTSAVIQAERVGASMAETLRHQAEDLRNRRREQALLLAQALPVKLVFPLVVCFLPGIFVSTLAPVIYQMIQVADSVIRSTGR